VIVSVSHLLDADNLTPNPFPRGKGNNRAEGELPGV
jgi:hypothetical protein